MVKHEAKHNQSSTYKMISLTDVLNVIQSFFESASTLVSMQNKWNLNMIHSYIQFLLFAFVCCF